ncbi:MAG: succinylglutamate desuccinylase/aspartoacylase family protein [Bacteroidales bacterium]|jgi:hypothetical protein|nr:succinylglutamate desuccinylase/aspartoacylase family protein [Bacteroidales bacterium]
MAYSVEEMLQWDKYPTFEVYDSLMRGFALSYPTLCRLDTIGFSEQGRLILSLIIKGDTIEKQYKPKFFYTSTIHGNELTGYIMLLRLTQYLLYSYQNQDERIKSLIDNVDIYINPLANPDGTYFGGNNSVFESKRYNSNYVDLNRNFPDIVLGDHPDNETYYQNETLAFMLYSQENKFSLSANLHTGAEVLNYPYDCYNSIEKTHADRDWFIDICNVFMDSMPDNVPSNFFKDVSSLGYINGGNWYKVYGGRQDYTTYFNNTREITFELSNSYILPTNQLNNYWNYLGNSLISYIEQCKKGLEGFVRDSLTGEGLKAKVFIENHDSFHSEVYSLEEGGYYYRPILQGTYSITYSLEGYLPKTITNLEIYPHQMKRQDVFLVKDENSIKDFKDNNNDSFYLYPNPAKGYVVLDIEKGEKYIGKEYRILNSLSMEVKKGRIVGRKTYIDISEFKSGVYIFSINNSSIKFIKQ